MSKLTYKEKQQQLVNQFNEELIKARRKGYVDGVNETESRIVSLIDDEIWCNEVLGLSQKVEALQSLRAKVVGFNPDKVSLCKSCGCMTHTMNDGKCGKCKGTKKGDRK